MRPFKESIRGVMPAFLTVGVPLIWVGLLGAGPCLSSYQQAHEREQARPARAYVLDVNHDQKPDVIVKTGEEIYLFIQQADGTYLRTDRLAEQQRREADKIIKGSLEQKVQDEQ
jgi:hypothetical protein